MLSASPHSTPARIHRPIDVLSTVANSGMTVPAVLFSLAERPHDGEQIALKFTDMMRQGLMSRLHMMQQMIRVLERRDHADAAFARQVATYITAVIPDYRDILNRLEAQLIACGHQETLGREVYVDAAEQRLIDLAMRDDSLLCERAELGQALYVKLSIRDSLTLLTPWAHSQPKPSPWRQWPYRQMPAIFSSDAREQDLLNAIGGRREVLCDVLEAAFDIAGVVNGIWDSMFAPAH